MTAKLLNFYDFVREAAAAQPSADNFFRGPAGASFARGADTRHIPRLRAPLECRWHIDPATGELLARWVKPSVHRGASANGEDDTETRQYRRRPLSVAGGSAAARAAA
jgi:hypothetical protein